ncbi:TPA: DUF6630 family protein [Streptococcus suis]
MLTEENLQDIFEIADLFSDGDLDVFVKLKEVIFASDPNEILDYIESILDPLAFDDFLTKVGESEKDNLWLILVTLLEYGEYICVREKNEKLRDFVHFFDRLHHVRKAGISLRLDAEGLNPRGSIPEWAAVIDGKFVNENYCLGAIDMGTENYFLFFNKRDIFDRIQVLAKNLGYRIELAKFI